MQRSIKNIAIIGLLGVIGIALVACKGNTAATSEVSATVNGKDILLSEVDFALNQQMQGQQAQLSPLELAQARLTILDTLISKEVMLQRAKKENLLPTEEEITQDINGKMQQSRMSEDEFNKQLLQATGLNPQQYREEIRTEIAVRKLREKIIGQVKPPGDKEVTDYYEGNKSQFVRPRGLEMAEISVNPAAVPGLTDDAKSDAEAKTKIDVIYSQLKTGADFATVARERSEDQYRAQGGDIGFGAEDQLRQNGFSGELIARLFALEVGAVTEPIQLNGAWYIFKVQKKQLAAENQTLDTPGVREQITAAITNARQQLLGKAMETTLMSEARITNYLAQRMLENPNNLSGVRPAGAAPAATPAPVAPAATPATSPATPAKPTASAPGAPKPSPGK